MKGEDSRPLRTRGSWLSVSGRSRLGSLVALLIVGALVYGGMKLVPVRAAAFQLDDAVREQVVLAAARRARITEAGIRAAILERADELGLPVGPGDIEVRLRRTSVEILVEYEVPIDLPLGLGFDWPFSIDQSGPIL